MNDDLQQSGATTTTQATVSQEQIKAARVLDFTWAPDANTTSTIVSTDYIDYQVDTSTRSTATQGREQIRSIHSMSCKPVPSMTARSSWHCASGLALDTLTAKRWPRRRSRPALAVCC
ncbi:hypothetical protein [Pseudomonas sp. WS 5532]|uniref:hypothetical protein n=2 Tax=Pseudomonas TaxID=286 RepID=UPI0021CCEA21|nr:hypothetical protein [Pseudomonas sp. WS 5532]